MLEAGMEGIWGISKKQGWGAMEVALEGKASCADSAAGV